MMGKEVRRHIKPQLWIMHGLNGIPFTFRNVYDAFWIFLPYSAEKNLSAAQLAFEVAYVGKKDIRTIACIVMIL